MDVTSAREKELGDCPLRAASCHGSMETGTLRWHDFFSKMDPVVNNNSFTYIQELGGCSNKGAPVPLKCKALYYIESEETTELLGTG